jgi:hypothetical protein
MKSFLNEIEKKFQDLEDSCEKCDRPKSQCECDSELDEMSTTGAVAGYNTSKAFLTPDQYEKKKKTMRYESVNTPPSFEWDREEFQRPESEEEELMDKFAYAQSDVDWQHKNYEYPSVNLTDTPGTATKKHKNLKVGVSDKKRNLKVEEIVEKKYEQLIESYKRFATEDSKLSPEQKVKRTIREVAKRLKEIEQLVDYNSKLKRESNVAATNYGPGTQKALTEISNRLIKISERVRTLGE